MLLNNCFAKRVYFLLCTAGLLAAQTPQRMPQMRPVVRGRQFAVSSMKPEASLVAERVLRAGGNAFDAIVAGQAVLAQVDGASNGVGSDAVILIYDSHAKKVISLNAEGTAPKLATIEWYKEHNKGELPDSDSLLAGTVPGVVDAWYTMLDRWGTMTFEQVLAPAIEIAEQGFPLSERFAGAINGSKKLKKYPSSQKVYYPNGKVWKAGEVFTNPDLARTLKRLVEAEKANASKGRHAALLAARDRFYKGDIAREMAKFSEENGGLFRYEDFAAYHVELETPISLNYKGYQVYKNPSASQGPAELFALSLLQGYDLKGMGLNSAAYIHAGVESIKLAMADREKYLGDMDFVKIPYTGLLSKEYAQERRRLIDVDRASMDFRPGDAEKFMTGLKPIKRPTDINYAGDSRDDGDTSYIAVVDGQRNMISFTPSLHSGFGTGVIMGDLGFLFNCRGDYYSLTPGHANALAPGKRPRSTLQGTLVMKEGEPFMVTGSPGGDDQCMRTMQTFLNVVEFGMNIQQAIESPRWTTRSFPLSYFPHSMYRGEMGVEDRIPQDVRDSLIKKGHKLKVVGGWSQSMNGGIVVNTQTGVLSAGADPRCDAYALAW